MKYDMPTEKHLIFDGKLAIQENMLEQEKKIRRKIANSNERRRMQSINAGFQSLRALLPHPEGEKLSKAAILQNAADYVIKLQQDNARLLQQNNQLSRRVIIYPPHVQENEYSCSGSPVTKKVKRDLEDCIDEGIGNSSPSRREHGTDDVKKEIIDLRIQLEHERTVRTLVEQKLYKLELQLHSVKSHDKVSSEEDISYYPSAADELELPSAMNLYEKCNLRSLSPQSQVSSQDLENSQEVSDSKFSNIVPQNFTRKTVLQNVGELSISKSNIPSFVLSSSDFNIRTFPNDFKFKSDSACKTNTSRQNLEVIVEAIRHVEGDHMFRDDSSCAQSNLSDFKLNHQVEGHSD